MRPHVLTARSPLRESLAREEVVPPCAVVARQGALRRLGPGSVGHRLEDGTHQQRGTEQIGFVVSRDVAVPGESHARRRDDELAVGGDVVGRGVDIGRQAVAQVDVFCLVAVPNAPLVAELPHLARDVGSVGAEDRQEGPELEPAGV